MVSDANSVYAVAYTALRRKKQMTKPQIAPIIDADELQNEKFGIWKKPQNTSATAIIIAEDGGDNTPLFRA